MNTSSDDKRRHGWRRLESEEGPDYGIFRVRLNRMVSPRSGHEGRYVALESPDWINVIALTGDGRVALVRQYRHGVDEVTLEIPSGIVDKDEEPLSAARRELAEETGYTSEVWSLLGRVRPNPAFLDNWCYSYLAEGIRLSEQPQLDAGEDISVELHPLDDLPRLIATGAINHALVINAFYRFDHRSTMPA